MRRGRPKRNLTVPARARVDADHPAFRPVAWRPKGFDWSFPPTNRIVTRSVSEGHSFGRPRLHFGLQLPHE